MKTKMNTATKLQNQMSDAEMLFVLQQFTQATNDNTDVIEHFMSSWMRNNVLDLFKANKFNWTEKSSVTIGSLVLINKDFQSEGSKYNYLWGYVIDVKSVCVQRKRRDGKIAKQKTRLFYYTVNYAFCDEAGKYLLKTDMFRVKDANDFSFYEIDCFDKKNIASNIILWTEDEQSLMNYMKNLCDTNMENNNLEENQTVANSVEESTDVDYENLLKRIAMLENRVTELELKNKELSDQLTAIDAVNDIAFDDKFVEKVGEAVKNHLNVNVDGYYEAYSGQSEHYHKTDINWSKY